MSKQYKLRDYSNYLKENNISLIDFKRVLSFRPRIIKVNDEHVIDFDGQVVIFKYFNLPKSFYDFMNYQDFIDDRDKSINDLL